MKKDFRARCPEKKLRARPHLFSNNSVTRFLDSNHIHLLSPEAGLLDFLLKPKLIAADFSSSLREANKQKKKHYQEKCSLCPSDLIWSVSH